MPENRKTKNRLAVLICCLLAVTVINFLLPRLLPGDPVLMLTGIDSGELSPESYAMLEQQLGLDKPLIGQFGGYLAAFAQGNLGFSYHYNQPVGALIAGRIPATLQIALPALCVSALLAVLMGCGRGRFLAAVDGLMILLEAFPGFLLAMLAVYCFGFMLGWLPLGGLSSPAQLTGLSAAWDRVLHLALPVTVVALGGLPGKYLLLRGGSSREYSQKYTQFCAARGLSPARIAYRHVLPNVCRPFIAMLGVNLGFMLSGSMVVETVFSIKGMGLLMYQSVLSRDIPVMQGCLLVTAVMVVGATLAADLLLALLDRRVAGAEGGR